MKVYLTSSLIDFHTGKVDPSNHLIGHLRSDLPRNLKVMFVASNFLDYENTDFHGNEIFKGLEEIGIPISYKHILDFRTVANLNKWVEEVDCIILAGGHVPTQNHFFKEFKVKEALQNFKGVLITISAGTMNCASEVYALPEDPEESIDENYQRYLSGLGLTDIQVIPHYQYLETVVHYDKNLIHDIVLPDSKGRKFVGLNDGSFIIFEDKKTPHIYGNAYLIQEGKLNKICDNNEVKAYHY